MKNNFAEDLNQVKEIDLKPYFMTNFIDENDDITYIAALALSKNNPIVQNFKPANETIFEERTNMNDLDFQGEKNIKSESLIIKDEPIRDFQELSEYKTNEQMPINNFNFERKDYRLESFQYRNNSSAYANQGLENRIQNNNINFLPKYQIGRSYYYR